MPHDLTRLIAAAGRGLWFIDPAKAEEIIAAVELRLEMGPRAEAAFPDRQSVAMVEDRHAAGAGQKVVRVLRLQGAIVPRGNMMSDVSGAVSLERFGASFRDAAADPNLGAIVLDIDSPGGNVALVPETVKAIRAARRADRPIVAVANTTCASAAYWIACAADELVATESATVGSIGVYMMHRDVSEAMAKSGVRTTFLSAGPRKVEANPFQPLDDAARAALMAEVRDTYDVFTQDVAKARGVPVSVVRADPEDSEKHFGGGRSYGAKRALQLGMIDRIETLDQTVSRLARGGRAGVAGSRALDVQRARLGLID